jgi:hypothetical protein
MDNSHHRKHYNKGLRFCCFISIQEKVEYDNSRNIDIITINSSNSFRFFYQIKFSPTIIITENITYIYDSAALYKCIRKKTILVLRHYNNKQVRFCRFLSHKVQYDRKHHRKLYNNSNDFTSLYSETCLHRTLSKPKTCLNQTDFTVLYTEP